MTSRLAITLNALALYAIAAVLAAAFYFQLALGELPCPLCLLQRVGFVALAIGPILTVVSGPRPRNYALVIIAALIGGFIAGRQVLLHIMPGDTGFGSAFLGYHFYTWAFICFAVAVAASAVMLLLEGQFSAVPSEPEIGAFERLAVWLVIAITLLNAGSGLLECGFDFCPSSPVHYELLKGSA